VRVVAAFLVLILTAAGALAGSGAIQLRALAGDDPESRINEVLSLQVSGGPPMVDPLWAEVPFTPSVAPPSPPKLTVYWLFAHPDDESLAAGGALYELQNAGVRNVVIIFSTGENTLVRRRLGLTLEQTVASRRAETREAMASIGLSEVIFLDIPDGQVTVAKVRSVIDDILMHSEGLATFRGHSPYDTYLGLTCGHVDHCAVGQALVAAWRDGLIRDPDVRLYREGQLFNGAASGACAQLSAEAMATKRKMRTAYARYDKAAGRYAIGSQSVPASWVATATKPECYDLPQ
jgi:LmbE family N-acetylglucosaminyl deacetylase